jgi:hypothetical protein
VRDAAQRLEIASTQLDGAANSVSAEARTAEGTGRLLIRQRHRGGKLGRGLAASIAGISEQAIRSTEVAGRAVTERGAPCAPCRS